MSATGEQGMTPHDPADAAGVGGGIIPDDQGEGYEEVVRRTGDGKSGGDDEDGRAAGQTDPRS